MSELEIQNRSGALRIRVRVKPRASVSRILGVRDGVLEISLAAPPVDGQANVELIRTLADALGVPKRGVEIVTGDGSRTKLISVTGLTEAEFLAKLRETPRPA